jgi:gliding motility-associated-like protein
MKHFYQRIFLLGIKTVLRPLAICLFFSLSIFSASAQCPTNIDFELGDFSGWDCYSGTFDGTYTPVLTPPIPGRHDMLSSLFPGNGFDTYGHFPKNCPNGSGHSIKIGNEIMGHSGDRVTYTFTIPAGRNTFNLIYNYAIVLNDGGNHATAIQPRLTISVKNLTDNRTDPCNSFDFAYSPDNALPGFFTSDVPGPGNSTVKCKNWSAASINLDGNAGKTIEISFTATGCGQTLHFGYAYIDINSSCSSAFTGATFCPDDTTVTVTAPSGYETYQWYSLTNPNLGNTQSVILNPPPLSGDSIFVDMTPFNGYGCPTTLKAYLFDTLTVRADAGVDQATCDNNPVQLGGPPVAGRVYSWLPVTGLSDPNISNPIATPSVSTTYTLTVRNSGGGCATPDIVNVHVDIVSDSLQQIGPSSHCTITGETVELKVLPHDNIQWYRNTVAIPGATQPSLMVTQTGAYYAIVSSITGCSRTTVTKQIDIWETPVAGFNLNAATQCDKNNQFIFTNTSTLSTPGLLYEWDFGDGIKANMADVTHSYTKPGAYIAKLLVTAPGGCTDSKSIDITVNPTPVSAFAVDAPVQCYKDNWFVFSNKSAVSTGILTYTWDFGDGKFDNSNDIAHHYAVAGTYDVKLSAKETNGGCTTDSVFKVLVQQSPITAFTIDNNVQCFPGHQFVLTNNTLILSDTLLYTWDMGDGIIKTAKDVNYSYAKAGDYTIKLLAVTLAGCKDSIYHNVIVHPTPTADFTIRSVCENILVPIINRTFNNTTSTVNYFWDFDNGHTDIVKSPVYSYPAGGIYAVKLTVSTAQCPVSYDTKTINVTIDDVTPGIVYPDKNAAFNFNEPLQARQIGNSVIWSPATSLSNRFSYTPIFYGISPQLYTIQIKTASGCVTVDTQLVKTHKKIEIYVPNSFTPDGNGTNDRLRPVLIGFSKVNYFRVFDRWGKLLFSMNSDQPGWDGMINNKPAETQTVVWMIEAVDVDGVVHNQQGTTVLFR